MKWVAWAAVAMVALNVVIWAWGPQIVLLVINAKCGCFPWSPKEVPYKPGMTICPGQTAIVTVTVPVPPTDDRH